MSARLGFARWHMQTMQSSEFLHLLVHSMDSAVSWIVFRGRRHYTAISGILLMRGVLSRAGLGDVLCAFFCSFTIFGTCRIGHFESHISNFSSEFCNFRSPTAGRYTENLFVDIFGLWRFYTKNIVFARKPNNRQN